LPEVLRLIGESRSSTFPVVDERGELVGVLSFNALRSILLEESLEPLVVARDLSDPHPTTITPETSLAEAFRRLESEGLEAVPVVDQLNPRRVLGLLSRADLIGAYNRTVATLGAPSVASWLASSAKRWSDGYRVLVLPVPRGWVGRSLRELDCRARYGVV